MEISYTTTKQGKAVLQLDKNVYNILLEGALIFSCRDTELWDIVKRNLLNDSDVFSRRHLEAKAAELIRIAFSYGA